MFAQTMGSCLLETFQSHVSQKSLSQRGELYLQILQDLLMLLRRRLVTYVCQSQSPSSSCLPFPRGVPHICLTPVSLFPFCT